MHPHVIYVWQDQIRMFDRREIWLFDRVIVLALLPLETDFLEKSGFWYHLAAIDSDLSSPDKHS
jgi:hypothetical protein